VEQSDIKIMINTDEATQLESLAEANVRMVLLTSCLQNIRDLESDLNKNGDIETFYTSFVNELTTLTNSNYGAFGLFSKDGSLDEFFTVGIDDKTKSIIGDKPEGKGLLEKIYRSGETVIVNNIGEHPDSCGFPEGHPAMTSLIGMPLMVDEEIRGVMYLTDKNQGEPYNETDKVIINLVLTEIEHVCVRADLMNELADFNILLVEEKTEQTLLIEKISDIQNQLLQSEKMASIGQLAAGVAHEINNPVGYVNSNITSLEGYLNDLISLINEVSGAENITPETIEELKKEIDYEFIKDDVKQLLDESKEGINRVKKIVHDLKDFSHVDEEEWQWTDIHKGIDSTLNVVNNEIKYKAKVIKEYGDLPDIECIASQLNQVFMNLLVNASHAIEEQGTITVRTGKLNDERVWIQVSDTGKKIKKENISRLFEPFFTTKPVGQGTGLGLSLSYGIAQKHGGDIDVESELNKGTKFTITLPIKQQKQKITG
jgi:signal transduction histidine kinase